MVTVGSSGVEALSWFAVVCSGKSTKFRHEPLFNFEVLCRRVCAFVRGVVRMGARGHALRVFDARQQNGRCGQLISDDGREITIQSPSLGRVIVPKIQVVRMVDSPEGTRGSMGSDIELSDRMLNPSGPSSPRDTSLRQPPIH